MHCHSAGHAGLQAELLFKRTLQSAMTLRPANRRTWWCFSKLGHHQAVIICFHKPPDCQAVLLCYKEEQPQREVLAARLIKGTLPAFPVKPTNSFGGCFFQQSGTLPSACCAVKQTTASKGAVGKQIHTRLSALLMRGCSSPSLSAFSGLCVLRMGACWYADPAPKHPSSASVPTASAARERGVLAPALPESDALITTSNNA